VARLSAWVVFDFVIHGRFARRCGGKQGPGRLFSLPRSEGDLTKGWAGRLVPCPLAGLAVALLRPSKRSSGFCAPGCVCAPAGRPCAFRVGGGMSGCMWLEDEPTEPAVLKKLVGT